jgi:nucleotide-binding universal stress UspA family protein
MTVVIGYVPTPGGEAALTHAISHARAASVPLVVVNTSRGDRLVDERYALEEDLALLERRLVESGVRYDLIHGARGREAHDEILDAAAERRADLVVIGIRRRTPVGKRLMGSTAQRVLLEADCPVLAVKA